MKKKPFFCLILLLIMILAGCIKETYNMKKFSKSVRISPSFSLAAASGDITLSNMVKQGDTVRFDNDKLVRVIVKKDSIIYKTLKDYYNLSNMVMFSKGYKIGELSINDLQTSFSLTLSTISAGFSPPLVDGATMNIPAFSLNLGEKSFGQIPNFQTAVFSSGTLTLSFNNNLGFELRNIRISLYNSVGHTPIGNQVTIPSVPNGTTQTATIDLAGKTVKNSIVGAISIEAPFSPSVLIRMNNTLQVNFRTAKLKVQSGTVIIPPQKDSTLSGKDIVPFDPGINVEIEKLKINTGNIGYTLVSNSGISGSFSFTLPTALRGTDSLKANISINRITNSTGSISLTDRVIDLSTDPLKKFNRIPVLYSIDLNSNGALINFNKNDSIHIALNMLNPDLDYVKGYFGQISKLIETDIISTGLDEVIQNVSGSFHIADPLMKIKYSNSFGIPIQVTLNASGKKNSQTVNLGLTPFNVSFPASITDRDKKDSLLINKNNSSLADLISMPPALISYSGSVMMNPAGPGTERNNFVSGNSRLLANLEIELPLQLWMKNLQFADTIDNFLKLKSTDSSEVKPTDFDSLRIKIVAENGFPLGASVKLMLFDSVKKVVVKTIEASNLILPAPVDANGKSTGKTQSTTTLIFNKDFFDAAVTANKMIYMFILNTSGNGTTDVKIYSDYSLSFKATVIAKPDLKLKLSSN
jgi:hypothetical protein